MRNGEGGKLYKLKAESFQEGFRLLKVRGELAKSMAHGARGKKLGSYGGENEKSSKQN